MQDQAGRLDVLVNNVGLRDRRPLFEFDLAAVRRLIETDLVAQVGGLLSSSAPEPAWGTVRRSCAGSHLLRVRLTECALRLKECASDACFRLR